MPLDGFLVISCAFAQKNDASAFSRCSYGQLAAVGSIPEPEMYAMLLLGLGLIGFLARGRATA
jgi:hypothetical protein